LKFKFQTLPPALFSALSMSRARGPRKRHWCFTSYNDVLPSTFDDLVVRYVIYQREICPETKREHLQGYIEFFDNVRMGQVQQALGDPAVHVEPRKGSRTQAREYCRKSDTAIVGQQFEWGDWRQDVNRKRKLCDILKTDMTLEEVVTEAPHLFVMYHRGLEKLFARRQKKTARAFRNVQVTAIVGPTGAGKTKKATSGVDWYILPTGDKLWFDGYEGEGTLIIDDFYGGIKYSHLLRILDGHAYQAAIKGAFVWARWTKVFITSNAEPKDWYSINDISAMLRRIDNIVHMDLPVANVIVE